MTPVPVTPHPITVAWLRIPLTLRKFIVDVVETAAGLVMVAGLFLPQSMDDVARLALVIAGAVGAAFVSAARRHAPALLAALRTLFPASL